MSPDPESEQRGIGWLLHQLLNPEPQPGPPYTHTFNAPEPDGYDENGDPIYLLHPHFTPIKVDDA